MEKMNQRSIIVGIIVVIGILVGLWTRHFLVSVAVSLAIGELVAYGVKRWQQAK
ncbi:hypothetical protein IV56_GL000486 [Lacticaseibacillus saniviri JCM 17471 = DSM 24301]|uniref:Uncharacterized protein n=2 Tax=Lacticaseibacillus saniviri TaxID=931533 RepID=A0A0R2MU85_9LACO|nr:hypothetical protein IV56_GL000486 [Lacticaseibacillus saniviri JCM 17471 = DSM 24301]